MILTFFFKSISQRIKDNVTEVTHVDLWNNQIAMEGESQPFNRPAVFIELQPVDWQTQGDKQQAGDLAFTLRVVTDTPGLDTNDEQTDTNQNRALERLTILEKVWVALHGYQAADGSSQFGKIVRTGTALDTNSSQLNTDVINFKCRLTDSAAVPAYTTVPLNLKANGELVESVTV